MTAWLWPPALGTVFLESGINSVLCSVLQWLSGEIHATAYCCEKKLYLLFADEDFSIEMTTYERERLRIKYSQMVVRDNQDY